MNEGLYLTNGYLNFDFIMNRKPRVPFIFIVGGRGTGKTYGAIKWAIEQGEHVLFMRRTQDEAETILNDKNLSAAKTPVEDLGYELSSRKISKKNCILSYIKSEEEEVDFITTCALSTFASLRGFSASQYNYLFFDEFIKEPHVHALKQEGKALFNAYETVSRNRELSGLPPLRLVCMSNSEDIYNPIFAEFGIEKAAMKMMESGINYQLAANNQIALYNLSDSPISEAKADTALYKLGNEDYNKMALANKFTVDAAIIKSISLRGMRPVINYRSVGFYSGKGKIYAAGSTNPNVESFGSTEREKRGLMAQFPMLKYAYTRGLLICENVEVLGVVRELLTF